MTFSKLFGRYITKYRAPAHGSPKEVQDEKMRKVQI